MPADVVDAAKRLLDHPDLIDQISADIEELGVVGEKRLGLLLFLAGVSAQLLRPLAVITRGASSSGKSFLAEQVSRLFPPEIVLRATSLTPNALYYFPPGELRHRWVLAGERSRISNDEAAEATRALREMIEAGKLSKGLPIKEGDRIVTRMINQDGPIAYTESTTAADIDEEDANRTLRVNTDESENQTRRILHATASAASGQTRHDVDCMLAVHHAVQRMIPRVDVVIPFADAIAGLYPTARLENRRDFRHLLQLVKAVGLLRFRQRNRDDANRVIATFDDYDVAERLAREPLGAASSGLTPGARTMLETIRREYLDNEFTTTDVKRLGGASPRTLENRLLQLNSAGVVEQTSPAKGRVPARWKLTGRDPDARNAILPTVDAVRAAFASCAHTNET
jgi:hypothetical protein